MSNPGLPPCTLYRLRMATRRATRLYDRILAPSGLTIAQFGVLTTIARAPTGSLAEVARLLDMERTTLIRNLATLRKSGLVRQTTGADNRSKVVELTDLGRSAIAAAMPLWRQAQAQMRSSLGDADLEDLHRLLEASLDRLPDA